jgi:hypothetical protein
MEFMHVLLQPLVRTISHDQKGLDWVVKARKSAHKVLFLKPQSPCPNMFQETLLQSGPMESSSSIMYWPSPIFPLNFGPKYSETESSRTELSKGDWGMLALVSCRGFWATLAVPKDEAIE